MCWWFRCRGRVVAVGGLAGLPDGIGAWPCWASRWCCRWPPGAAGRDAALGGPGRWCARLATCTRRTCATSDRGGGAPVATRRAGENLYWLGRYTERATHTAQLAPVAQQASGRCAATPSAPLRKWISQMQAHAGSPAAASLEFNLRAMHLVAASCANDSPTRIGTPGCARWKIVGTTSPPTPWQALVELEQAQHQDMTPDGPGRRWALAAPSNGWTTCRKRCWLRWKTGADADPTGASAVAAALGTPPQPTDLHQPAHTWRGRPAKPTLAGRGSAGFAQQAARLPGIDAMAARFAACPIRRFGWRGRPAPASSLDEARRLPTPTHASQCARQADAVTALPQPGACGRAAHGRVDAPTHPMRLAITHDTRYDYTGGAPRPAHCVPTALPYGLPTGGCASDARQPRTRSIGRAQPGRLWQCPPVLGLAPCTSQLRVVARSQVNTRFTAALRSQMAWAAWRAAGMACGRALGSRRRVRTALAHAPLAC